MHRAIEIKLSIPWRDSLACELDANPYESSGDEVRKGLRIHVEKAPKTGLGTSLGFPRIEFQYLFANPKTYLVLLAYHGTLEVVSELLNDDYLVSWVNDEETLPVDLETRPFPRLIDQFGSDRGTSNE